jgi:hypothetical protein
MRIQKHYRAIGLALPYRWKTQSWQGALRRSVAASALLFLALILAAYSQQPSTRKTYGVVVANMDRSVKPGDDFYRYANGDWIKRTEIPPDSG